LLEHEGKVIADSDHIVQYLSSLGFDLDQHLDPEQKARSTAIRRMVEEHLYWPMVYSRFVDEPSWSHSRDLLLKDVPKGIRPFVGWLFQREVRAALRGHGMGRHSKREIYGFGCADIEQLALLLGTTDYFMGERVSGLDATAYAFLACILIPELQTPLTLKVLEFDNLTRYVERLRLEYYGS
jgi:glutathione S-transferase